MTRLEGAGTRIRHHESFGEDWEAARSFADDLKACGFAPWVWQDDFPNGNKAEVKVGWFSRPGDPDHPAE